MVRKAMMVLPYPLDPSGGGVQRSTLQMGQYLSRIGWEVVYVSFQKTGHKVPDGVVVACPEVESDVESDIALLDFLRNVVDRHKPDVVFNQVGFPRQPALALHKLRQEDFQFKTIACFRNSPAFYKDNIDHSSFLERRMGRWVNFIPGMSYLNRMVIWAHRLRAGRQFRQALDRCDRLMLLAPSYVEDLKWYLPDLDESRVIVVPNAYAQPESVDLGMKKDHLLFVGRLRQAQKNVLMLPALWHRLQDRLPGWEFHIVGYGPDKERMEVEFRENGAERVFVHGRQRAESFFEQARIFVMTSSYEGFANTLVEAQMHGTVPVAFRSFSAITSMVNDRLDAILIPPYDLDAMAEGIIELVQDQQRLLSMAKNGIDNAKRFTEERVGSLWTAILEELMDSGEASRPTEEEVLK